NGVTGNHFPRGWVKNAGGYFGAAQTDGTINAAAVQTDLIEHVAYSRYQQNNAYGYDANGLSYPYQASRTVPERLKGGAYSYLKAPRWAGDPMEVAPWARLVVAGEYPIDMAAPEPLIDAAGTTLQQVASLYTKGAGLDPKMIHPDLAVACVRAGLAELSVTLNLGNPGDPQTYTVSDAPTGGTNLFIDDLPYATIVAAYQAASAVIIDGGVAPLVTYIATMSLGLSTMDRLRARALESAFIMIWMMGMPSKPALAAQAITWANNGWVSQLAAAAGDTYTYIATPADGLSHTGIGGTEAPRGALMHICTIGGDGKIERYQCIVPTTWNACPRDAGDVMGPMEQAIVAPGTGAGFPAQSAVAYAADGGVLYPPVSGGGPVATQGGVEALRIAQSFDPCIACAVH
ncbi:MAG: nickel-dependent hydrogenase large subunit, partial [Actinobacteria bacterium]